MEVFVNPAKPIKAFFVFASAEGMLVRRRGFYFGLPGDYLRDDEDVIDCARRSLGRLAMIRELDSHHFIGGSESYTWDNQPVVITVFSFETADIVAPMHQDARRVDIKQGDIPFDITVDIYRKLITSGQRAI